MDLLPEHGAYTSAASSTFNRFPMIDNVYVYSVPPQNFTKLVAEGRVNTYIIHTIEEEDESFFVRTSFCV